MKKNLLSLGLAIGVASAASAQSGVGLKGGVSLANVKGDDAGNSQTLVGFQAGLMADISLSQRFSFHPELVYSQKGAKVNFTDSYVTSAGTYTATHTGQVRLAYLDLPLLLRAKAAGLFFEAGPQLGVLLSQYAERTQTTVVTYTGATGSVMNTESQNSNSTAGTRRLDVGYVLGVGYHLPLGLEAGVRYNGGLASLDDSRSAAARVHNSVFQFQLGYLFSAK